MISHTHHYTTFTCSITVYMITYCERSKLTFDVESSSTLNNLTDNDYNGSSSGQNNSNDYTFCTWHAVLQSNT